MNSLVFVVVSGIVTLALAPPHAPNSREEKPVKVTHDTLRRVIEFSRIRWHSALILNRRTDAIITDIREANTFTRALKCAAQLNDVIGKTASHFDDPADYLWDASVGTEVASVLRLRVIDGMEDDLARKQTHARRLVENRLSQLQARKWMSSMEARQD